jgi:hypothetical protein
MTGNTTVHTLNQCAISNCVLHIGIGQRLCLQIPYEITMGEMTKYRMKINLIMISCLLGHCM